MAGRDRRRGWAAPSPSAAAPAQREPAADGRPLGDAAGLHPPRRRWSSEQTRGAQRAGGADRQRGPGPGPSSAGRRGRRRARLRRGRDRRSRRWAPAAREAALTLRPGRVPRRSADAPGRRSRSWFIDVVPDARADGELRRRAARDPPQRAEASTSRPATTTAWPSWRSCWRPRAARARSSGCRCSSPANQPPKVASGTYPGPDRAPAGRPAGRAAARGGRRDRPARPERAAGDRPCRRASSAIRWRARSSSSGASSWRRPRPAREVAGGLAALGDTRAAQQLPTAVPLTLAGRGGPAGVNEGDAAQPALGGRPALGAGAVHRGRLAVDGRAQAARPAAGAAAGPGARAPRTPSSSG